MVAGTGLADDVALEERQRIVADLDQLPMPEAPPAAGADPRLGPNDSRGQDVIASRSPYLPIGAATGLLTGGVGDVVVVLAVQARDGVGAAAVGEGDLLEALLGERQGPQFAGVERAL